VSNNTSLKVSNLKAGYELVQVIFDISFDIPQTGITAIVGRNGAGKTTLLQTIVGYISPLSGKIEYVGNDITRLSVSARVKSGIGYVPQDRPVFSDLTVRENLLIGASRLPKSQRNDLTPALDIFPKLADRLDQKAGTMSGGERKMVGISRALIGEPKLLIMDEPTEGVWHGVVDEIQQRLKIYSKDHAVLIVEQNLEFVAGMASQVLLIERGQISQSSLAENKSGLEAIRKRLTV